MGKGLQQAGRHYWYNHEVELRSRVKEDSASQVSPSANGDFDCCELSASDERSILATTPLSAARHQGQIGLEQCLDNTECGELLIIPLLRSSVIGYEARPDR